MYKLNIIGKFLIFVIPKENVFEDFVQESCHSEKKEHPSCLSHETQEKICKFKSLKAATSTR